MAVALLAGWMWAGGGVAQEPSGERNFDLRTSQDKAAEQALERLLESAGTTPSSLADEATQLASAQRNLRARVPALRLIASVETGAPEVVGALGFARLTGPSGLPREEIARGFVEDNSWLYGLPPEQAVALALDADTVNPAGNVSWIRLKQTIHGLPVFRGTLTVAMTKDGEIFRTMGQLAAALSTEIAEPEPVLSAAEAVAAGADALGMKVEADQLALVEEAADGTSALFERGPFARPTRVELVYFPLGLGAVELAWSMTLWGEVDAYYVLVSAAEGLPLFSKNITESQTQSATYQVYRNANAYADVAESPAPLTPGPTSPTAGTQGALLSRTNVTLIGNEGASSFNDLGWITDDTNGIDGWTDGNNVEAGLDIDGSDGVDAPVSGVNRVFSTAWNPPPGSPGPGDAPTLAAARAGAVIQMFYTVNRYHDAVYQLGFTEAFHNFQNDNFGRGGTGGDRISAQGQDSSGSDNANFTTPPDGSRGKMQMYVFTAPTPDRDGAADADVMIHELTHGLSNRLHANASGLTTNMARGMGEGWSDFYAHSLLSEPSDPLQGIYSSGGYVTPGWQGAVGTANYYYGIRRFPKAVMASTGGPGNLPHNPLTFADLNAGCDLSDGAYPPASWASPICDQTHNAGEVWSAALWEVRALLVGRLGWAAGNERALQIVTDGMKLDPVNPTFLDARDSILAAASTFDAATVEDVWEGFRIRGMGFSAEVLATSPASVVEAFDPPNAVISTPIVLENISCADGTRSPIPGETLAIEVPVENTTGLPITNVVVALDSTQSAYYGTIEHGTTVSRTIFVTIAPEAACGSENPFSLVLSSEAGSRPPIAVPFQVGANPVIASSFSNPTAMSLPGSGTAGPASPYPSALTVSGIVDPVVGVTVTLHSLSHTATGDLDVLLEGPGGQAMVIMSDAFTNGDAVANTLVLDDSGSSALPLGTTPVNSGTYRPTNHGAVDFFDTPAPAGPWEQPAPAGSATLAGVFGGTNPNGSWNLWIDDDVNGDTGVLAGGWSLGVRTTATPACPVCVAAYCTAVLDVSNQSVDAALDVPACQKLSSGDFEVVGPNGAVTFRAGSSIELRNGFAVGDDSELSIQIDPSLLP
jgi:subtilisin-like proprotein convertase family protein